MNGVHDELEFRTAPRLTNLLYTDALPHLPLPQIPQPCTAATTNTPPASAASYAQDASFLELAASMLQSADLSYMCATNTLPYVTSVTSIGCISIAGRDTCLLCVTVRHAASCQPQQRPADRCMLHCCRSTRQHWTPSFIVSTSRFIAGGARMQWCKPKMLRVSRGAAGVGPALPPLQQRHLTLAAAHLQATDAGASPPSAHASQAGLCSCCCFA